MKTKCPRCGEEYEVEAEALGRKAECAACGAEFQVQDAEQEAAVHIARPSIKTTRPAAAKKIQKSVKVSHSKAHPRKSSASRPARCPYCQNELLQGAVKCSACGEWLPEHKPKDPIPYFILLLLCGNLGLHDFYAKHSVNGIIKIGLFLFGLLLMAMGEEYKGMIIPGFLLLGVNAVWCLVDLCRYKENLKPPNKS